jgi:uncharacterized protein YbjT (DUF2867 family)
MAAPAATAPSKITALVAGGTGLVGGQLLELLTAQPDVTRVIAVTRRILTYDHPKLANRIVRFEALEESLAGLHVDVAFCCLGTTMRAAGSRQAFRLVDHDFTLAFARAAHKAGAQRFVLNSSVGADPESQNFYLRTKGETEVAVAQIGFPALDILQPSLLLGLRKEVRPLELAAMMVMPALNPLLLGAAERYRAVSAATMAAAMLGAARSQRKGTHRHTHRAIVELARDRNRRR